MRHPILGFSLVVGVAVLLPPSWDGEKEAQADVSVVRGNPGSLVSGAYFLLLYPKKMGGKTINARRPGILPVDIKTDGKTIVIGGKYVQMTGHNEGGSLRVTHLAGVSLTLQGNTFNGYAASGTFSGGAEGNFEGSFALSTVSGGGYGFLDNSSGAGVSWQRSPGAKAGLSGYQPAGSNKQWGYDGPGLNMDGGGRSENGFSIPGMSGANADGGKGWTSGLNITSGQQSGSDANAPGSQKAAADRFAASAPPPSAPLATNDGGWCDWVKCAFIACSAPPSTGGSGTGTTPIKPDAGGFQAGDWEPMGGDTSPGQKPKTGNGQEQGAGSSTLGSALHLPLGGGDPGDFFKPAPGDVLNTNKLFNGASDPTRGANFGR